MRLNDIAWKKLFDSYHIMEKIKEQGFFDISADQINSEREARLMTKFDHKIDLPEIFKENQLSILPTARGDYCISSFSAYKEFETPVEEMVKVKIPSHLQSLTPMFLTSEAIALNCANACNILADFSEDEVMLPTVNGRMTTGQFAYSIHTNKGQKEIIVNNAQMEIDAAYEGISSLSLYEAKMDLSKDFLVRQLYYPYRAWSQKISKPIKPIFLIYANGIFRLYEYQFIEPNNYNSLILTKQKNYMLTTEISVSDIENLLRNTPIQQETTIPFPQADSMERVVDLISLLHNCDRGLSKEEITQKYMFTDRQADYYANAARYLGFVEKNDVQNEGIVVKKIFKLTNHGKYLMNLPYQERQLEIAKQILGHHVFREALKLYFQSGQMPDNTAIIQSMKESDLFNVSEDSTYKRRASTVKGWINWIISIIDQE